MPARTLLHVLATLALSGAIAVASAVPSAGDLSTRYRAGQARAGTLQSQIAARTQEIQGYEGSIQSLQGRLDQVQQAVSLQERLLFGVRVQQTLARNRLTALQAQFARGQRVLADELRAEYESPPPTLVGVIVSAGGFDDLLNRVSDLRAIERANARMTALVRGERTAVAAQTRVLGAAESRRARATAAVLAERDQIATLKLSIVGRELAASQSRDAARARLTRLQTVLSHEAATLEAQAALAAAAAGSGGVGIAPAGCVNTSFVVHGGEFGFFPAPGTDYTVNEEPVLAARLDALGRALQLHLIGISGYRSPAHSVEVGGFADDPHTEGRASDTPGVEGVPEATLERFCLTRPFPGAREADHIQELGG